MNANLETYEGHTNRETWAVALHINNDQAWQESVHEALRDFLADKGQSLENPVPAYLASGAYLARKAGEIIRENVESLLTVDGYIEATGFDCLPPELSRIAEDIGSLYRVDWTQLGADFLRDIEEG